MDVEDETSNYDMVQEAIEYLESEHEDFVSMEWIDDHQNFFIKIRGEFPDFSAVNEDVRDMNFRNNAARAEVLARKIENAKYFDVINYCKLCKICYELYQYCEKTDADEDDLASAFGKMNVTKK